MSEKEIKISLEQIAEVLRFVKLVAGLAFSAIVFIVGLVVWVKLTDTQLQANTHSIEVLKNESVEMQKISTRTLTVLEQQQQRLDRLQTMLTSHVMK